MNKTLQFRILIALFLFLGLQQAYAQNKCKSPDPSTQNTAAKTTTAAIDFTVISTQGDTLNLFKTLDQGKTVFLDFFYTTCGYCIQYAPIIEQAFQNHGAGTGDIAFWGLDNGDSNAEVDAYKIANNVSNPCASGLQGNSDQAINLYVNAFTFTGYPTYTIICPDRTVHWDVNYPPNTTGFNTYFSQCGATAVSEQNKPEKPGIKKLYPVPAGNTLTVEVVMTQTTQARLEVYDLLGIKVLSQDFDQAMRGANKLDLNLSELRPGTYFVKLMQDNVIRDIRKFTRTE